MYRVLLLEKTGKLTSLCKYIEEDLYPMNGFIGVECITNKTQTLKPTSIEDLDYFVLTNAWTFEDYKIGKKIYYGPEVIIALFDKEESYLYFKLRFTGDLVLQPLGEAIE